MTVFEGGTIPFGLDEIEDCRILIKAKGKHYSIISQEDSNKDDCRAERIAVATVLLTTHNIVDTPLEEIRKKLSDTSEFVI